MLDDAAMFDEIEQVIGREAALALCAALGGQAMTVPSPDRIGGHRIAAAIGEPAALAFAEMFQGENLYVPLARRQRAAAMFDAGATSREVADATGLTMSAARKYRRSVRAA